MYFQKYAVFSGRSTRKEYWIPQLFNILIGIGLGILENLTRIPFLFMFGLFFLATLIPSIAVSIRRLHDTDRSGWLFLVKLIPFVGSIIFLIFMVLDSQPTTNQYGPNPKASPLA